MSGFSTRTDNMVLDAIFRGEDLTFPEPRYLALFSSGAGLTENTPGAWTEISGGSYARIEHTNASMSVADSSQITNTTTYSFPIATEDWGVVSHIALMDALTGGNVIAWGMFRNPVTLEPQPRTVYAYDQLTIRDGALVVRLEDNPNI